MKITLTFKFKYLTILMIFLMLLVLNACKQTESIKIGVIGTMSGQNSDLSVSGRRGIEMAADEINKNGGINGRMIELVVKDDKNDTIVALQQQINFKEEGVKLVIGHYTSGMVMGVINFINKENMLLLGPTISADSLSKKDDNFIRFIASTKEQAIVLSDYTKLMQHRSVAVLYDIRNKGFTDMLVRNYIDLLLGKTGIKAKVFSYNPQKSNEVEKVKREINKLTPDALFLVASAEDCAKMAKYFKSVQPKINLYGPLWANTAELIRKGGTSIDGMVVVGALETESSMNKLNEFKTEFEKRYGEKPTFSSVFSYETLKALARAIEKAKNTEPEKVKKTLIELGKFEGLQGNVIIDKYGDNTRKYLLFKFEKGSLGKVD
jgi:branched-chain amino acid transport system substrate-binding protein